jgi:hypothetical protein
MVALINMNRSRKKSSKIITFIKTLTPLKTLYQLRVYQSGSDKSWPRTLIYLKLKRQQNSESVNSKRNRMQVQKCSSARKISANLIFPDYSTHLSFC